MANAVTHHLDRRLAGLARKLGVRYPRYADDLAFSVDATPPLHQLLPGVRLIVRDEGFRLRDPKTCAARGPGRQQLPRGRRTDYDALRALLYNCVRTGPESQNRHGHPDFRAHLLGRIGWIAASHPGRAAKLRALSDRISWPTGS